MKSKFEQDEEDFVWNWLKLKIRQYIYIGNEEGINGIIPSTSSIGWYGVFGSVIFCLTGLFASISPRFASSHFTPFLLLNTIRKQQIIKFHMMEQFNETYAKSSWTTIFKWKWRSRNLHYKKIWQCKGINLKAGVDDCYLIIPLLHLKPRSDK